MSRLFLFLFFPSILLWTVVLNIYHAGVFPRPNIEGQNPNAGAQWYDKDKWGIHHLVLDGPSYARGLKAGELTKDLLLEQEQVLNAQMETWFPERWMRQLLVLGAITWFQGADRYFEKPHLLEMYGTSKSAPHEYDYLADGFTRQVAYHGLHEVGQMMVDQGWEDMGCTVIAIPRGRNWILGRNFDFEGGRIFDREKIVKWVFPDKGIPFVSVIWAGMVGAVTGVNAKGVYISINAGGSSEFRRIGTPSTLVTLKVLQEAENSDQAVAILKAARMFITDIFTVMDAGGNLFRVEKSPEHTIAIRVSGPAAITNHLVAPMFENDPTNKFRKSELTTLARFERGQKLAEQVPAGLDLDQTVNAVLAILRDKGIDDRGRPIHLGNRRAIDALIATHAVIYDGLRGILYVSQGPALAGPFLGYDLNKSFAGKAPVYVGQLARDPLVSDESFNAIKDANQKIAQARRMTKHLDCARALNLLETIPAEWREQSPYYHALGDAHSCAFRGEEARAAWRKALDLVPAYAKDEKEIKRRMNL